MTLMVVDDGSEDGTQEWVRRQGIELIECPGGNVARNRQEGLRSVIGGPVAWLDNDVEVTEGWWDTLEGLMRSYQCCGIVAPQKVYGNFADYTNEGWSQGRKPGDIQNCGNAIYPDGSTGPVMAYDDVAFPDYVEAACMVVKEVVWKGQNWDHNSFPFHYEDVDYCFQARARGYAIVATRLVSVVHHAHSSSRTRWPEFADRRAAFMKKWKVPRFPS